EMGEIFIKGNYHNMILAGRPKKALIEVEGVKSLPQPKIQAGSHSKGHESKECLVSTETGNNP
ncbi:hypothetical protein, partial [Moorena sp. SIO3F7]